MKQSKKNCKVGEQAIGKDAIEIKLQIAELHQARAVAQDSQQPPVSDNPVKLIGEIQVFLNQRVGGHAQGHLLWLTIQTGGLPITYDVERRLLSVGYPMGNRVVLAVQFRPTRLIFELIAKETQERNNPKVARLSGGRRIGFQRFDFVLKSVPIMLGVGPDPKNFVLDLSRRIQLEVSRLSVRQHLRCDPEYQAKESRPRCECSDNSRTDPQFCAPSGSRM